MAKFPKISEAEWVVMEVLWKNEPLTALEVVQRLTPHHEWKDRTIRTMLQRLIQKKAVKYQGHEKAYYYSPAVTREECVQVEQKSFLERIFAGNAQPLLVQLVKETQLSAEQVAELKKLLQKKDQ